MMLARGSLRHSAGRWRPRTTAPPPHSSPGSSIRAPATPRWNFDRDSGWRNTPGRTRQFSMHAGPVVGAAGAGAGAAVGQGVGAVSALAPFLGGLDRISPYFEVDGSQVQILRSPSEFYETLKVKIKGAKKRIFLSTLYIGKTEKELIETIQEALRENSEVKISILTDALRGTREAPDPSCASLLSPLVEEFGPERVEIRMYHTPNLTGLKRKYVPKRINEGWGLQHMKLYGVDDEIIISGANLSTDYFTNRQDRYHLFSSKPITDFFWDVQKGVESFSFRVEPSKEAAGFELAWPKDNGGPSPLEDPSKFTKHATTVLNALISKPSIAPAQGEGAETKSEGGRNTRVYMLAQMSQLLRPDTSTELPAITHLLGELAKPAYRDASWTFTAGYFNPAPSLTSLLLSTSSGSNTVLTASPQANGFYRSAGVSGLLPDAYTILVRRFLRAVAARGREGDGVTVKEWRRGTVGEPGAWTYHAKGLWVTLPRDGPGRPCMSVVGSSNYTKRSYSLDLEVGALIVTADEDLKRRLGEEESGLQEWASRVTRDDLARNERRTGFKVRAAMWIVKMVGGAL